MEEGGQNAAQDAAQNAAQNAGGIFQVHPLAGEPWRVGVGDVVAGDLQRRLLGLQGAPADLNAL